ncbi:replication initiation and membrane attachment family protein [Thalassobacillus hwangdonensis]|uniref:Replication initiation and membrane attachment family protein n=1 Tax=Thalassobacillus hwangdonensis TaxID=546108 RepID=A0ABW3L0F3_9BACI
MHESIGKLFPVDGFMLQLNGIIPRKYNQSLTHLYQPVLGIHAVSLFHTLLNEYELSDPSEMKTHHTLMNHLSLPLDQIYEGRRKLEAIGLLQTYVTQVEEQTVYIYELQSPFSPEQFFNDDMLTALLRHALGGEKYNKLHEKFIDPQQHMLDKVNVTATFEEVFHGYGRSMRIVPKASNEKAEHAAKGPNVGEERIDFQWIEQALKEKMYPAQMILSVRNKKVINQMAALYNLSGQDIEKAIGWALNEENQLVLGEFKEACHDLSKTKAPSTGDAKDVLDKRVKTGQQEAVNEGSKKEQLIARLERISPRELLEDLSGGNDASDQDLKLVRDIMTEQGLSPGVMNVLVHYVMLKTDMKLSKSYMGKIASHWARKNVTTVRQAMTLAKAEHQKYQQWGKERNVRSSSRKKEVIPDWFKNQKEQQMTNQQPQTQRPTNKEEIAARIRRITNKGI